MRIIDKIANKNLDDARSSINEELAKIVASKLQEEKKKAAAKLGAKEEPTVLVMDKNTRKEGGSRKVKRIPKSKYNEAEHDLAAE